MFLFINAIYIYVCVKSPMEPLVKLKKSTTQVGETLNTNFCSSFVTKIRFICLQAELLHVIVGKIAPHIRKGTPSPYGMVAAS